MNRDIYKRVNGAVRRKYNCEVYIKKHLIKVLTSYISF